MKPFTRLGLPTPLTSEPEYTSEGDERLQFTCMKFWGKKEKKKKKTTMFNQNSRAIFTFSVCVTGGIYSHFSGIMYLL